VPEQPQALGALVDGAPGGATAEQHARRTAQQLQPVVGEGVALSEGGGAQAVAKVVAGAGQAESAQVDALLPPSAA